VSRFGYLRFLNSFPPSLYSPVTYSNPASMSWHACVVFWATLLVHWSVCSRNSDCSMLMYVMVDVIDLCPSIVFTWMMSLVLWYSIVAFQCLNVWKVILCILGFCSFWAAVFRCVSYAVLSPFVACANKFCLVRGSLFIMLMSLSDMRSSRGLLFFDGVMFSVFCSVDRSIHLSFLISDILAPVSLSVCSSVAMRFPHDAINRSISVSVGMNGILASIVIRGFVHLSPRYLSSAA